MLGFFVCCLEVLFIVFGWFCWVSFAGSGEGVEPFLGLGNSRKSNQFSWPIRKIFSPASFAS